MIVYISALGELVKFYEHFFFSSSCNFTDGSIRLVFVLLPSAFLANVKMRFQIYGKLHRDFAKTLSRLPSRSSCIDRANIVRSRIIYRDGCRKCRQNYRDQGFRDDCVDQASKTG